MSVIGYPPLAPFHGQLLLSAWHLINTPLESPIPAVIPQALLPLVQPKRRAVQPQVFAQDFDQVLPRSGQCEIGLFAAGTATPPICAVSTKAGCPFTRDSRVTGASTGALLLRLED